ncbi:MAG: hypothetical protein R3229_04865 [Alphaproteobacteria bacterium]|nr:hypothetical protein [Alphaproteobacteria bacterium]
MALSGKSLEALMDLVEIKLSCVEIFDREDAREVKILERCRDELQALKGSPSTAKVIDMPRKRRVGRPRAQAV